MIDAIIARPRDGRRVSEIKNELGEMMNRYAAVFRDEAGLQTALETIGRLKEETERAWIDDRGTVFNQDVLGAIELGYMVDCAETTVVARDRAQGVARRAVPHRLPRAQRRGVAQAHRHHAGRRRAAGELLAGDDHPVAARGEEVLMAETHKAARAVHAPAAPLRPRVRRGALLGRAHGRARAPPLGARGDPAGARPLRRLDRDPLLLPPGDLRLLRRARQRRTGARLPHAPRRRPGGRARTA